MRRLMVTFAALALLAGACGDDDDTATTTPSDVTSSPEEDPTTSSTTTRPTSTSTPEDDSTDGAALGSSCTSPEGFTIDYPEHWDAVSDCGQFGPAPVQEPTPATDERTGVVSAYVDAVPFEQVAEPTEGDATREESTIDGHPAVRVEGEQSGAGLYPEGTAYVRWIVDLSDVRGSSTLFLDAYDLGYDIEFDQAVVVLDDMAQTVEVAEA